MRDSFDGKGYVLTPGPYVGAEDVEDFKHEVAGVLWSPISTRGISRFCQC